jgi:hypothetical protein
MAAKYSPESPFAVPKLYRSEAEVCDWLSMLKKHKMLKQQ